MNNNSLRPVALFIATIFILSGCFPAGYSRPNTSQDQADRDFFQCEIIANREVPPNTQISTNVYTGQVFSLDTSQRLRREFVERCMIDRGYHK